MNIAHEIVASEARSLDGHRLRIADVAAIARGEHSVRLDKDDGAALQENLLRSHCAGVGEIFNREEARAMMVARINSLARGYSAIRAEVLSRLVDYVNLGITPAIPHVVESRSTERKRPGRSRGACAARQPA